MSSTCLVGRREALASGFTDGMRVAEDVDLVWRLAEQGWRVRYEPAVEVAHEHRSRLGPWFARKLFYGTGAADLADRHPDAIPPAILRPWSAAVAVSLLCARWWSAPVALGITAVAAWRLARRLGPLSGARTLPARLAAGGVVGAMTQVSALALRHWWPVGAVAMLLSRRLRWIIGGMAVVDAVIEHRRLRADLDLPRFAVLRRLDDIAYGAGVWWGSLRRRSLRALRIELRPRPVRARRPPEPAPAAE
jgi:mycofactocin system glycosyltransferase